MRNIYKMLFRDHMVPEVYVKTCPQHYTVSAVPETRAVAQGLNRPRTMHVNISLVGNEKNLGFQNVQHINVL